MTSQLEIGPGDCPLEGDWDTLDAQPRVPVTYIAQWGYDPLPIADEDYSLVFSSHVIEHIAWYKTIDALKEVYRILKPGGIFECWTVDLDVIVKAYQDKRMVRDWDCGGKIRTWMESVNGNLFAYEKHGNPFMWHKAVFSREYLKDCMYRAGFLITRDLALSENRGHDHGVINMGVWAKK